MGKICQNCLHARPIHPMEIYSDSMGHQLGGMKISCTLTGGIIGEFFDACEKFKKFIGWAYR